MKHNQTKTNIRPGRTTLLALALTFNFLTFNSQAQAPNWAWAKSAGGTQTQYASAVTSDASGNVYVAGWFRGSPIIFGSTTLNNAGVGFFETDMFIVKYDASGNALWAKRAGGVNADETCSITSDALGNVYVVGWFTSSITFGSTTLNSAGGLNMFIVKYNSSGNVLWAKSDGGNMNNRASSVTSDASGNVYVSGWFNSPSITFGSTTLINAGSADMFIAKYDANGNALWAKSAGGTSHEGAFSVTSNTLGNVYVSGWFNSPSITFGSTTLINAGYNNMFIAKYDANGNVLWAKSAGGTGIDYAYSVASDASGNVYAAGAFASPSITFGSTTLSNVNAAFSNMFIAKYDANGNELWAKSTGNNNGAKSITTDGAGNVYMTGYFTTPSITFGSTTLNNAGLGDVFVAKYDVSGNTLWAKKAGGIDVDQANSITSDASGNIYVAGVFKPPSITFGSITLSKPITGCDGYMFLAKLVQPLPLSVTINSINNTHCITPNGTATANPANGNIPYTYIWSNGQNTQTATGLAAGIYTVTVIDANGYTQTQTVSITQLSGPTAAASASPNTITAGANSVLTATGGGTYQWTPITGLSCTTCANTAATPLLTTEYCVVVTDTNNCKDTACITIKIELPCGTLFIPNAFSPNNDGENDEFCLQGGSDQCIKELTITIYDRWGENVYASTDKIFCWDGKFSLTSVSKTDQVMNTAVFVYYLNATLISGDKIIKQGNISLIK